MKRTNLLRKSINLALSILVAGSIVAVGTDGTTLASIFGNNDAIITSVVDAAEVAQIPWSTAYVYGLLPIDLSTGELLSTTDGSYAAVSYWAGNNKDWTANFATVTTADKQTLQFQFMAPVGSFPLCGQATGGYYFTDTTGLKELDVVKCNLTTHKHLWEYTKNDFISEFKEPTETNTGINWYDVVDEGLYYRITCSFNSIAADGVTPLTGLETAIEIKATGEVYGFAYRDSTLTYNDILAKEIIYSCVPTKLQ